MPELPEYRGWTIDFRARELRKVRWDEEGPSMESLSFDEERGDAILTEYLENAPTAVRETYFKIELLAS